jgi:hypothetical protein
MRYLLMACLFLCPETAVAQSAEKEPVAIAELGGAGSWNIEGGGGSFGPTVAVEFTPIENWLEIEAGVTPLFARHSTEWDTDLLFKKPWTLSKKVEFMLGVGPEWVHARNGGVTTNSARVGVGAYEYNKHFSNPGAPPAPPTPKPPATVPSPQMEEHTKGARPSTADDHQKGTTRKGRDARGGEKRDKAREDKGMYPRKRPSDYPKKGPWPPKPPKPPDPPPKPRKDDL